MRQGERPAVPQRAVGRQVGDLDADHGAHGQEPEHAARVERLPHGQRQVEPHLRRVGPRTGGGRPGPAAGATPGRAASARRARARSSDGRTANTSRIVSLNWRTDPNPAANATSVTGSAVPTSSARAVCARRARASACGPAPSSATSIRCTCRGVYPSSAASASTPPRSSSPSPISRIARPTASRRRSHSGVPGVASGRQRLQAR